MRSDRRIDASNRGQFDIFAARLALGDRANATSGSDPGLARSGSDDRAVHPREHEDIARMRNHRVDSAGSPLQLLRGEFHRHTEISSHRDQDGLLEDSWRYALDAANLDWMGNGDHMSGFNFEYMWWFIQKMTDLHQNPPGFVAALTYERSAGLSQRPPQRDAAAAGNPAASLRQPPGNAGRGNAGHQDPLRLLEALRRHLHSHTSATGMGTDWRDNDPDVEPVVEIYQGHRHNYEH